MRVLIAVVLLALATSFVSPALMAGPQEPTCGTKPGKDGCQ
jgi:hypothetical protein